jgi:hypothetical protein
MFADAEGGIELDRLLSASTDLHPRVFHNGRYIDASLGPQLIILNARSLRRLALSC